ncbi:MAG TPA: hypothetical protein VMZ52_13625 [Bryobacteraceae bacterium]|nr:hypothetical protein [Bryobacteraceae bacterium]
MLNRSRAIGAFAMFAISIQWSSAQVDVSKAQQYFGEAQAVCSRDAGKLWGVSLCGPLLFVDPRTRMLVANQADAKGVLQREGSVFVGSFPKELNVANHAVEWSGTRWTQLRWPLTGKDVVSRQGLLAHEMFHRVQEQLGFAAANPGNSHLDSEAGRVLLRAEMRALKQALLVKGAARTQAALDAVGFRAARRAQFAEAGREETSLELNEGLSEYTGIKLSRARREEQLRAAAEALASADHSDSYVRSFAYSTGPAYGLLLDDASRNWRKEIAAKQGSLDKMLAVALKFPTAAPNGSLAKGDYGLAAIRSEEAARRQKQEARLADAKARFMDGPVLVIPLVKAQVQFDPNNLYPFPGQGTVYPDLRLADEWGILTVKSGGALIASDWSKVTVPASGEGWDLELKPGWSKQPGKRAGDFLVFKE